jgi:putative transposase
MAVAPESDRLDSLWRRLEPLQARAHQGGRPCTHDRRQVLAAILYVQQTDCGWRALPSNFPPWQTVYAQLRRWQKRGIWDEIWSESDVPLAPE